MTEHEIFWMASLTRWNTFEQALGVGDRQGSLACCSPWGRKELYATEQLNRNYSDRYEVIIDLISISLGCVYFQYTIDF